MNATRRPNHLLTLSLAALGALAVAIGCSSTGGDAAGTGGSTGGGTGGHGTGGTIGGIGGAGTGGALADAGAGSGGRGTGGLIDGTGGHGTGGVATTDGGTDSGVRGTGGASTDAGAGSGGRGTGGASTDAGSSDGGGTMTLTSPTVSEGVMIPAANACTGANLSPELDWTAGPSGTMGYAVVLMDLSNNLVHWVIWDIPAATLSLPAGLAADATLANPAGAKQTNYMTGGHMYQGPCPPAADGPHRYQFEVRALDVATLPGVTANSTPAQVRTQILSHTQAFGDLTGTFDR